MMREILSLLPLLLFVVGCDGLEHLISELDEYGEYEEGYYECYYGNARLPVGTRPKHLIGLWECRGGDVAQVRLYSNGISLAILNYRGYLESLDYSEDCGGYASWGQTGQWVVDLQGRLCAKNYGFQPGIYNCQWFLYSSNTINFLGYVDFYEDGTHIGSQYEYRTCTLVEE